MDPFDKQNLDKILFLNKNNSNLIGSRESSKLEFKENFNFAEIAEYLRDFAAFTNNSGGYLVFGIKDSPRDIKGTDGNNFDSIDEEKVTGFINELFAPTIEWQKEVVEFEGLVLGVIYIWEAFNKPVIAIKDGGRGQEIKNGEIYYRYIGRSQKIRYPELKLLLDAKLERERAAWQEHLERMVKIGASNAAILDTVEGTIEGTSGTVLIDDELIPKLKFIREGQFVEREGKPTLKLVGQLKPASVIQKVIHDDPYKFRAKDVSTEVERRLKKPFKDNPHHIRAWKYFKIREKQKDGSWEFDLKYCDYKAAINYFLYNQNWIDHLAKELSDNTIYNRIVG